MPAAAEVDLSNPQYYFNRELSWLEFNRRVLHEAIDPRTLLLERLKFMAIFSSNLDEFFMVRVAALKQQVEAQVSSLTPDGQTPQAQLRAIAERLGPMLTQQQQHFEAQLRPQLAAQGVDLLDYPQLNEAQRLDLQHYFEKHVFPVLTPLAVDPSHPFPHLANLSLNLAVQVRDCATGEERLALLKVPDVLPRFIPLPASLLDRPKERQTVWSGVPLEQVIAHHLEILMPGMQILGSCCFRVTRNADLELEEDEADDLLQAIEQELRKRRLGGMAVRLEIAASAGPHLRDTLIQKLELAETDCYDIEGLLGLQDLMSLTALPLPKLKHDFWPPVTPMRLRRVNELTAQRPTSDLEEKDIFSVIRRGDLMVHHPYHSFVASVQLFITQAAQDPDVLAIKMTLYRTAGDSPILNALITAAEQGKQVAVLVELKARFDEANNINWARQLENAGVHVVYGLVGLKTHTKVVLVVRREAGPSPQENRIRRYVHIGTGNYNHKTARRYTDIGLFSCQEELGADLTDLFNYLTGYSRQQSYRRILVAPVNLRDRLLTLIRREIDHSRKGRHGRIVAKMNALADPQIISALYEASQAGVKIDLIVRGVCCLRPGLPGISDNINVVSIVGRYLEHSRIFYFHDNGAETVLIGSADWMAHNLDRRVEVVAPITDPAIAKDLQELLGIMLADNRHAWDLQPNGEYIQRQPLAQEAEQDAQTIFMEMAAPP